MKARGTTIRRPSRRCGSSPRATSSYANAREIPSSCATSGTEHASRVAPVAPRVTPSTPTPPPQRPIGTSSRSTTDMSTPGSSSATSSTTPATLSASTISNRHTSSCGERHQGGSHGGARRATDSGHFRSTVMSQAASFEGRRTRSSEMQPSPSRSPSPDRIFAAADPFDASKGS